VKPSSAASPASPTSFQSDRISEQRTVRVDHSEIVSDEYDVPEEWTITVKDEQTVSLGDPIAQLGDATIAAQHVGKVRVEGRKVIVSYENRETDEYEIPTTSRMLIEMASTSSPASR
jgi:DNA-directed RNA polymerase subunit beta'